MGVFCGCVAIKGLTGLFDAFWCKVQKLNKDERARNRGLKTHLSLQEFYSLHGKNQE
jgi:hypothetical protein